jgi:hypothetical protein
VGAVEGRLNIAARHQQGRTREAGQGRDDMPRGQAACAEERRRQHDDEQGPQVVEQVGLDRRRQAQRGEQRGVVGEQPVDPERQHRQGRPPGAHPMDAGQGTDQQRRPREQERRQAAQLHGQRGQRAPEQDGQ